MDELRHWFMVPFQRLRIRDKIIAVYIPLIIIPLFVLGYFSSNLFTDSLISKTKQNVINESNLIITRIDSIIGNSESCANIMMANFNHIYANFRRNRSPVEDKQMRNQIQTQYAIDLLNFPDIDSVAFIDRQDQLYTTYFPFQPKDNFVFINGFLENIHSLPSYGVNNWLPMQYRDYLVTDTKVPVLSIGKEIIDLKSGRPFGTLVVNVKESTLSAVYAETEYRNSNKYFILDQNGIIISSPIKSDLLKPLKDKSLEELLLSQDSFSKILNTQTGRELVTSLTYGKMGWKLVNIVPVTMITDDIRKNTWMTVLIGAICLVFAILGAGTLSIVIVNPLQKLTKAMRRVKDGQMDVSAQIHTADEIGLLSSVFDSMIERMKKLLHRVELDQKMKKEYELALIHAQIKPHFLYNTLDLIYILNDMDRNREARDTTKALADFYRVALSKGSEMITIGEEIKNANDYLSIQRVRYPDVFDFDIEMPQELMRYEIPKLSIQPLIENAIYHGLKMKGDIGHIHIKGCRDDQGIYIIIQDDGIGIKESKLLDIWKRFSHAGEPVSFGIFSVHERIRLYFGDQYGVTINSVEGQGTEVRLRLPADWNRRDFSV
jgi:two-component system, sensor histidine kinase YesM